MENFKEIAKKCLAGELRGIFIFNTGMKLHSQYLKKSDSENYFYLRGFFIDKEGHLITKGVEAGEIINFIPDNMQEQIKINIPEGKVPVMEQTENGVVITWKEKGVTYDEIYEHLHKNKVAINYYVTKGVINNENESFLNKMNILRKLTNIRNYFGKPSKKNSDSGWVICINGTVYRAIVEQNTHVPVFAEKEHAEQAIKMLGDELKYLFEPW